MKNRTLSSFGHSVRNLDSIQGDDLNVVELKAVWLSSFKNIRGALMDCGAVYVTAPQGGSLGMMMMMMEEAELPVKHILIWVKNAATFSMGRLDYDYEHEPIFFTWKKTHKRIRGGEFQTSVWRVNKPMANKEHPTMKPVALVANAIQNSSEEGDLVIDFFLGSGTTMVAAHQLRRRCYGMEIEPKYCQVVVDRMRNLDPEITVLKNGNIMEAP